jgi:hypothetical protein
MAAVSRVNLVATPAEERRKQRRYRFFGLLNGLLFGLALAAGIWGPEVRRIQELPVPLKFAPFILGAVVIVVLGAFAGWLTARLDRFWITALVWLGAGVAAALVVSLVPSQGRSVIVQLVDRRFAGRNPYPILQWTSLVAVLSGLAIIVGLTVLAFFQEGRLQGMVATLSRRQWLSGSALLRLLLPLPFVAVLGWYATDFQSGATSSEATEIVHEAIQVVRAYDGDLLELGLREGTNYNALRSVRDQMDGAYQLFIGVFDPANSTTIVVAHFDNGLWLNCRVVLAQLASCQEAPRAYTDGLASLITGDASLAECPGCRLAGADEWRAWFAERRGRFSGQPVISRQAQSGNLVLMRAASPDGRYALECWIEGFTPIRLQSCADVE